MGMVFGYFIGVSFPSVSLSKVRPFCLLDEGFHLPSDDCIIIFFFLIQIILPSSFVPSLDVAFNDTSVDRSFPENLGSGSTPTTPKVDLSPIHGHCVLHAASVKTLIH